MTRAAPQRVCVAVLGAIRRPSCVRREGTVGLLAPLVCLATLAALSAPGAARADVFGPIELVSSGALAETGMLAEGERPPASVGEGARPGEGAQATPQQALYAHDPAVSGDGRYVAFDGYFDGRTGVWRRELQPPYAIQPVAVGAVQPGSEACEGGSPCDAELPSISAYGQYVSFTTTARLDPREDPDGAGAPNVYVRNMDVPEAQPCAEEGALQPASPCAYTLASAVDGGAEALTYANGGAGGYGAVAAGRSALSADGLQVAFVTTAVSNLAGQSTPALQVAVRNLATGETQLVSTAYDPATGEAIPGQPVSASEGDVAVGAVYSPQTTPPAFPFDNRAYALPPAVGASISADGSTVAWMGRVVAQQAQMLPGESVSPSYAEPLWRRVADGPLTPTRRVTGGSQPESAACLVSGEAALPPGPERESAADPCQGPFAVDDRYGVWAATVGDAVPQLSADGYTVAFLASAQLVALGLDFGRSAEGETDDLYVADMDPYPTRLTRTQALRPLTELASGRESQPAPDAPIVDLAVSPDGTQVAFSTARTAFPLGSPAYVSQPAATAGMAELFDADLADDTLTRVTQSVDGGPSERPHPSARAGEGDPYKRTDGALSPSFSAAGGTLVFSSTAANLVYDDGTVPGREAESGSADGSSVYAVARRVFAPSETETYVSGVPESSWVTPDWRLGVTARSLADGRVELYVEAPGAGTLSATAQSPVAPAPAVVARAVARRRHSRATRARAVQAATSVVATTTRTIRSAGLVAVTLTLAPRYLALADRPGGLSGSVGLTFAAPELPNLQAHVAVSFRNNLPASRGRKADARRRRRRRR
jgi:hypothetical protein